MRTCSAQTRTEARFGFTFIELMATVAILGLFVAVAIGNFSSLMRRTTFRGQIQEFVGTLEKAAMTASEKGRRYEVIIDLAEQIYTLREISSSSLSDILNEEIISESNFSNNCMAVYVLFDDGDSTNDGTVKFRVGPSGWQYGGKIIFLDGSGGTHSVVISRLSRLIELYEGDAELAMPKNDYEVPF